MPSPLPKTPPNGTALAATVNEPTVLPSECTDLATTVSEPIVLEGLETLRARMKARIERFFETDLHNVKVFDWERQELSRENIMTLSVMQIYCWRRTVLKWASLMYLVKLGMEVRAFQAQVGILIRSYTEEVLWDVNFGEYTRFFRSVVWIDIGWGLAMVIVAILAMVYVLKSARKWKDFNTSVKRLSFAWIAICGTPWLWSLFEPMAFTLALSARGLQQQICEDIIDGGFSRLQPVLDLASFDLGAAWENTFDGLAMWEVQAKETCQNPSEAYRAFLDILDTWDGEMGEGRLQNVKVGLRLIFDESTWDTFFGILYIRKSRLGMLYPTLLGLMFGIFRGADSVRTFIPYSRIPGLLMLCGAAFSAPFIIVLFITANALLGNIWLLFGLICIIAALILMHVPFELGLAVKGHWTLMTPVSYETASQGATYRSWWGIALYILGGIFIVVGLVLGAAKRAKLLLGKESLLEVILLEEFWASILSWLGVDGIIVQYVLTAWTITSITHVIFTDWVLHLVLMIDGDVLRSGPGSFQDEKQKLSQQLQDGLSEVWATKTMSRG